MLKTVLYEEHLKLGAKMAEFAGYDMPLYYQNGIIEEHMWTRTHTGIFDVSHMGAVYLSGPGAKNLIEYVTPGKYTKDMAAKYTVLLNENGGIVDDLIVTQTASDAFILVVNASRKHNDLQYLIETSKKFEPVKLLLDDSQAMIAVQGRESEAILSEIFGHELSSLEYMNATYLNYENSTIMINRTGYTGEDGFELLLPSEKATELWQKLMTNDLVRPVGLAARDSLRLEAGYPLYGADLNETISPIEASLGWLIGSANTQFCGHERILKEKGVGAKRQRFGVMLEDKGVLRPGLKVYDTEQKEIGYLSSGGYSPVLKKSVGFAYLEKNAEHAIEHAMVNIYNKMANLTIIKFPFVPLGVKKAVKANVIN